ncbi:hypothetical protein HGA91_06740 [candidate division WWE3 bacterium]|nr:hypothetical protein [candidate division WWE3 bacterium]
MKLIIDMTQEMNRFAFGNDTDKVHDYVWDSEDHRSILTHFILALEVLHLKTTDLTEIQVVPGPGNRFTRTRNSVVFANTLAFALDKKINGKLFETPTYHREPNITLPK